VGKGQRRERGGGRDLQLGWLRRRGKAVTSECFKRHQGCGGSGPTIGEYSVQGLSSEGRASQSAGINKKARRNRLRDSWSRQESQFVCFNEVLLDEGQYQTLTFREKETMARRTIWGVTKERKTQRRGERVDRRKKNERNQFRWGLEAWWR